MAISGMKTAAVTSAQMTDAMTVGVIGEVTEMRSEGMTEVRAYATVRSSATVKVSAIATSAASAARIANAQ